MNIAIPTPVRKEFPFFPRILYLVSSMKPVEFSVPDALWKDRAITETAKTLWCFLRAFQPESTFTLGKLHKLTGLSHHTLHNSFRQLQQNGWIAYRRLGLRTVWCQVRTDDGLRLPSDILLQPLPRPAKWVWAVLRTLDRPVTYRELQALTGYGPDAVRESIRRLLDADWLIMEGTASRPVILRAVNPVEARRQAEIRQWEQQLAEGLRSGLSRGQCILYLMVRMALPDAKILVNARLPALTNPLTDAELEIDIYLPDYRLGLEFNGPQHYTPTEWFSEEEQFRSQRARDLMKLGLCQEKDIDLLVVTVADLWPSRIWRKLAEKTPVREIPDEEWHLVRWLYKQARRYREAVNREHGAVW